MKDIKPIIAVNLSNLRKEKGLTQAELAEHTGLTLSYISQLESPNLPYCPSVKAIFTIAKALGIKAYKILDIDD